MKTKLLVLMFSVLTFFCLIGCVYAQNPLDAVVNEIGNFFALIIETIMGIFFAILDFFGNLILGV
jgi:hypothetical protein